MSTIEIPKQIAELNSFVRLGNYKENKGKIPIDKNWQQNQLGYSEIIKHTKKGYNYGVICGVNNLAVIDADNEEFAKEILDWFPKTCTVKTQKGSHFYYKLGEPIRGFNLASGEVRCIGGQVVGAGSYTITGEQYQILVDEPIAFMATKDFLSGLKNFRHTPIIQYANQSLEKVDWNDIQHLVLKETIEYYILECPVCHDKRDGASLYKNSGNIECNKKHHCLFKGKVINLPPIAHKTLQELRTREDEYIAPPERFYPFLPQKGGLVMIHANAGVGKSHFAMALCKQLINKAPFHYWDYLADFAPKITYYDGEMMHAESVQRLRAHGINLDTMCFVSHERVELKLVNKPSLELIYEHIEQESPDILVLDTISAVTAGIDIMDAKECTTVINEFLLHCRKLKTSVIFLHHSNKSEDNLRNFRGSGALEDILDATINLKGVYEEDVKVGFKVRFGKTRSCESRYQIPFEARSIEDNGTYVWSFDTVEQTTRDKLLKIVEESEGAGITTSEAAKELDVSLSLIARFKKDLIKSKVIAPSARGERMRLIKNTMVF